MLSHIRRISEYEFHLEFQPQVSHRSGLCLGCEALLRAHDSQGRLQQPGGFLRWLGDAGLMREVDLWVAGAAVRQCRLWRQHGFSLPISINVTGATLTSPEYCSRLLMLLAQARGQVGVEITEEALVGDVEAIRKAIGQIHALGAKVAIDDFGTGFSSMSYLHQFDVDAIKIDRSFVVASGHAKGALVLDGLLRFCEALQLNVVAEGVGPRRSCRPWASRASCWCRAGTSAAPCRESSCRSSPATAPPGQAARRSESVLVHRCGDAGAQCSIREPALLLLPARAGGLHRPHW